MRPRDPEDRRITLTARAADPHLLADGARHPWPHSPGWRADLVAEAVDAGTANFPRLLLVIVVALGGYLYFVESKRTPGDDGPKKEKVFTVEADKIEEIAIKAESGEQTALKKSGTDWQIVSPVSGQAG